MGCNANYAAYVKRMLPQGRFLLAVLQCVLPDLPDQDALTGLRVRHNYNDVIDAILTRFGVPAGRDRKRAKADTLAEDGTLNPAPEKVRDPKFEEDGFFDPRDVVQVKYEMLRRASVERVSVTEVSEEYGVSRPTYYQAKAHFEESGIAGLVPRKRGPRGPHKIQGEVSAFLRSQISPGEPIRARELAKSLQEELGLDVHPRTIERALGAKKIPR